MRFIRCYQKKDEDGDYVFVPIASVRRIITGEDKPGWPWSKVELIDGTTYDLAGGKRFDPKCFVPADPKWKRASYQDGDIFYDTIVAFGIEQDGSVEAYTLNGELGIWDAAVDPDSGLYVMPGGDEQYTEEDYKKMMAGHHDRWKAEEAAEKKA